MTMTGNVSALSVPVAGPAAAQPPLGAAPTVAVPPASSGGLSTQVGWNPNGMKATGAVQFAKTWASLSAEFRGAFFTPRKLEAVDMRTPEGFMNAQQRLLDLSWQTNLATMKAQFMINTSQGVTQSIDKLVKQQ